LRSDSQPYSMAAKLRLSQVELNLNTLSAKTTGPVGLGCKMGLPLHSRVQS
jgi:hypothetical protein